MSAVESAVAFGWQVAVSAMLVLAGSETACYFATFFSSSKLAK